MLKSGCPKEKDFLLLRPKKHSDQRGGVSHIWDLVLDRYGPKAIMKRIQKLVCIKIGFNLIYRLVYVFRTMESFELANLAFP